MTHAQRLREALAALLDMDVAYKRGPKVEEAVERARAALAEADAEQEPAGAILPDGSAFMVASFPLPKDHWLYAPRTEWDSVRDDFAETPIPILSNQQRHAVAAAARYAIRGATMCGKEMDFDPDAMVQNFCYAMCGSALATTATTISPPAPAPLVPLTDAQCASIANHLAFRFLLNVNDENRERVHRAIKEAAIEGVEGSPRALAAKNGLTIAEGEQA